MTSTLSPGQAQAVAAMEAREAGRLEGKSQAFLSAYNRTRFVAGGTATGSATRVGGPGAAHGAVISPQYLQGQHQREARAAAAEWHDHATGTTRYVDTAQGPVSAEADPLAFLRAHGLAAIDADGDEVMPSAAQARGLVGAYLDVMQRNSMSSQPGHTSVSFRDPQMRGSAALVRARRIA